MGNIYIDQVDSFANAEIAFHDHEGYMKRLRKLVDKPLDKRGHSQHPRKRYMNRDRVFSRDNLSLGILILLLLSFCINCAPQRVLIKPLLRKDVQVYGGFAAFTLFSWYNATADAVWFTDKPSIGSRGEWHKYKNNALLFLVIKAGLAGLEVGSGNSSLWRVLKRSSFEGLMCWDVWQLRKHYVVSGNAFDFRADYNRHLIVIPWIGRDRYIGMRGWQVPMMYGVVGGAGMVGFWRNR